MTILLVFVVDVGQSRTIFRPLRKKFSFPGFFIILFFATCLSSADAGLFKKHVAVPSNKSLARHKVRVFTTVLSVEIFLFCFRYADWSIWSNRISGVLVCVLASSAADREFKPRSAQAKDYMNGICCFSAKHTALMRKSKEWLARNQDYLSEWGYMSIRGLLFQWASATIKIQLSV
jgi:hypothetical protein